VICTSSWALSGLLGDKLGAGTQNLCCELDLGCAECAFVGTWPHEADALAEPSPNRYAWDHSRRHGS